MDTLRSLKLLARAIELGSLSAVARELHTSQPTVSKMLAALEADLGVRLIERTTTRLTPTEAGLRFHEHATRILEDYDAATASARGLTGEATGLLRINAPLGFGEMHLDAVARRFLELHPGIEIELILNDRYVDLVEEGVDLAIRLGGPLPASAVARTLATARRLIVASPAYLKTHAPIRTPEDLDAHEFVRFPWLSSGTAVELTGPAGTRRIDLRGRYSVNSALAIRAAAQEGQALSVPPAWLVQDLLDSGRLVNVLPRWQAEPQILRVVYPSRRFQPARTRIFMDYLADALRSVPGLDAPAAQVIQSTAPTPRRGRSGRRPAA